MKNGNGLVPALNTSIPLWKVQTNSRSSSHFSFGIHFLNPLNILARWRQRILKYGAFSITTSKISLDWLSLKLTRLRAVKSQNSSLPLTQARVLGGREWTERGLLEIWRALARADGLRASWRQAWDRGFLSVPGLTGTWPTKMQAALLQPWPGSPWSPAQHLLCAPCQAWTCAFYPRQWFLDF